MSLIRLYLRKFVFTHKKVRLQNFKSIFPVFFRNLDLECHGQISLKDAFAMFHPPPRKQKNRSPWNLDIFTVCVIPYSTEQKLFSKKSLSLTSLEWNSVKVCYVFPVVPFHHSVYHRINFDVNKAVIKTNVCCRIV